MQTLRAVYPYGLNYQVADEYMKYQYSDNIGLKFHTLKRFHNRPKRRTIRKGHHNVDHQVFLINLKDILTSDVKEALK